MKNVEGHLCRWNPYRILAGFFVCALVFFSMCMTILQIEQPSEVISGEVFEIVMQVDVSNDDDTGDPFLFIVGFLVPRAWNAVENTTVRFESSVGNSTMRLTTNDEIDGNTKLPWTSAFIV